MLGKNIKKIQIDVLQIDGDFNLREVAMIVNNASSVAVSSSILAPTNLKSLSKLQAEETIDSPLDLKNISNNKAIVVFDDAVSGNCYGITLTKENLQRLQEKFGVSDFYQRKDGAIRLNGEAESYVSGWFGEVAYNMGALKAETNREGKFTTKGKESIKDDFYLSFDVQETEASSVVGNFEVTQHIAYQAGKYESIDEMIDQLITEDKNFDGVVSLSEHFSKAGELQRIVSDIIQNGKCENCEKSLVQKLKDLEKLGIKSNRDSKDKAMRLLSKLRQSGDLESLNIKEQEMLKKYFAGEVERIKQESSKSLESKVIFRQVIDDFVAQVYSKESLVFHWNA